MKAYIKITAVLIIVILCLPSARSTIINVPADYSTIQAGIDASSDGDTVLVQPGTYIENINFDGHNIVLSSLFLTTGNRAYIESTIIDGDSAGSVVTFAGGEDSTTMITGFTIQNGVAKYGGGIYCLNSSPYIKNNIIKNNAVNSSSSSNRGGGIYCRFSNPAIIGNSVIKNKALGSVSWGGGIYCEGIPSPTIESNEISENLSFAVGGGLACYLANPKILHNIISANVSEHEDGGGIYSTRSQPLISDNIITNNSANYSGGGISAYNSECILAYNIIGENVVALYEGGGIYFHTDSSTVEGNIIFGNYAENSGGGISLVTKCATLFRNNSIVFNRSLIKGGGLYFTGDQFGFPLSLLSNTIIRGNLSSEGNEIYINYGEPIFAYSNIQGGWPGEGNIDCDPMFCFPELDNFYLLDISCCIGAGCDSLGNPDSTVDIGALGIGCNSGGDCAYIPGDINGDRQVIGGDVTFGINYFRGGSYPPDICYNDSAQSMLFVAGDVNGDCQFIGSDITMLIRYFRGQVPELGYCPWTPPREE
jgi:hypothetical protein